MAVNLIVPYKIEKNYGEYSDKIRKNVNKYSHNRGLGFFGYLEYLKSWFPKMFPEDAVNKAFYKRYFLIPKEGDRYLINQDCLQYCLMNFFYGARNLLGNGPYNSSIKEEISLKFKEKKETLYVYKLLSRIYLDLETIGDNIFKEFDRIPSRILGNKKEYLKTTDLFELTTLVYKIILYYEQNYQHIDSVVKYAKEINTYCIRRKYNLAEGVTSFKGAYELERDANSFRRAFSILVGFYKRALYPLILKYIDSYYGEEDDENRGNKERDSEIFKALNINEKDIFSYALFEEEQKKLKEELEAAKKGIEASKDYIINNLEQVVGFLDILYPELGIKNITNFEYMLPYVFKNIIRTSDLVVEAEEIRCISKEDSIQIILSLFAIIWYNFLKLFDLENNFDNTIKLNELSSIKTRFSGYFKVFKRYFQELLEYYKDEVSKKHTHEIIIDEIKGGILNTKKIAGNISLVECINDLVDFLNEIETERIGFFLWSKHQDGKKIESEDAVSVFINYKNLIISFQRLLNDKGSFLIKNSKNIYKPTNVEIEILQKYGL